MTKTRPSSDDPFCRALVLASVSDSFWQRPVSSYVRWFIGHFDFVLEGSVSDRIWYEAKFKQNQHHPIMNKTGLWPMINHKNTVNYSIEQDSCLTDFGFPKSLLRLIPFCLLKKDSEHHVIFAKLDPQPFDPSVIHPSWRIFTLNG